MKKNIYIGLLVLSLVLAFQACTKSVDFAPPAISGDSLHFGSSGNGEGYEGKLTRYQYNDAQQPCLEAGRNGKALPNAEIFSYSQGGIQLVRERCTDITPVALDSKDITALAPDQISYAGTVYTQPATIGDFDVLAADCPAGMSAKANPTRQNLFANSQDLSAWQVHAGVTVLAEGSLASLPLFSISRNDPNLAESYRRAEQIISVQAGQLYAFSFFAKPDSNNKVRLMSWSGAVPTHNLQMTFDLGNGNAQVIASDGVSRVSSTSRAFADGIFITVYFSPNTSADIDIGIAADDATLGIKIFATAAQLDQVANFCGP